MMSQLTGALDHFQLISDGNKFSSVQAINVQEQSSDTLYPPAFRIILRMASQRKMSSVRLNVMSL